MHSLGDASSGRLVTSTHAASRPSAARKVPVTSCATAMRDEGKVVNRSRQLRAVVRSAAKHVLNAAAERARRSPVAYAIRSREYFSNLGIHEEMLADSVRVSAYARALANLIKPSDIVLDLGTGTGVLAFMAARSGANSVHAVEHGSIINVAKRLATANGLRNITFHNMNSNSLHLDKQVDILVHEQMGDSLFEERMVSNVANLRDRLLKQGGIIIPATFNFFIEPVALKPAYARPFIWNIRIEGIDFSDLRDLASGEPPSSRRLELHPFQFDRPLAAPTPSLQVDLYTITPAELPTSVEVDRVIETAGTVHGVGVWFNASLDDENSIDTSPFSNYETHWKTPVLRLEDPFQVAPGDRVRIHLEAKTLESIDSWTWSVEHVKG